MGRKRKHISIGSVIMLLFAAAVLAITAAVIIRIRGGQDVLTLDAERLTSTISALLSSEGAEQTALPSTNVIIATAQPAEGGQQQPMALPTAEAVTRGAADTVTAPPQEWRSVTLSIGGLFAPDARLHSGTLNKDTGAYQPQMMMEGISAAVHADVNIALLNDASAASLTEGWYGETLHSVGFDWAVPMAERSVADADNALMKALGENALAASGVGAQGYSMHTVNGITIAVMTFSESASTQRSGGWIPAYNAAAAEALIADARSRGANVVLVCMNWRAGTATEQTRAQRETAQTLCEFGADILIGMKRNVVWPVEYLYSQSGHSMLTAWSLGTLLSSSREDRAAVSGLLLHFQLNYDRASGQLLFNRIEYTPCYIWGQDERGVYRYRLVQSALPDPEGMNTNQSEYKARSLKLIQDTMNKGVAQQR